MATSQGRELFVLDEKYIFKSLASIRPRPLDFILQHEGELDRSGVTALRQKTSADDKSSSKEGRKETTMFKYKFKFKGGAKRVDNANFKFHCFVVDGERTEHHLYRATSNGIVQRDDNDRELYNSIIPVVKIFTATAGFGIPKEYFSYFVMLNPDAQKIIKIKPLGFEKLPDDLWVFYGAGRFMKAEEIRRFFGHTSDTWKFYQRQSMISKRRLQEMVEVYDNTNRLDAEQTVHEEVRMLRMD